MDCSVTFENSVIKVIQQIIDVGAVEENEKRLICFHCCYGVCIMRTCKEPTTLQDKINQVLSEDISQVSRDKSQFWFRESSMASRWGSVQALATPLQGLFGGHWGLLLPQESRCTHLSFWCNVDSQLQENQPWRKFLPQEHRQMLHIGVFLLPLHPIWLVNIHQQTPA